MSHALREGRKVSLGEIVPEVIRGRPSRVHWDAGSAPAWGPPGTERVWGVSLASQGWSRGRCLVAPGRTGALGLFPLTLWLRTYTCHLPDLSSVLHSSKCTDFGDFTTCCLINYLIFRSWVSINSSGFPWYRITSPVRTNGFISFSPLCNTNANRVVCYLHHNVKVNEGVFVFFLHLDWKKKIPQWAIISDSQWLNYNQNVIIGNMIMVPMESLVCLHLNVSVRWIQFTRAGFANCVFWTPRDDRMTFILNHINIKYIVYSVKRVKT